MTRVIQRVLCCAFAIVLVGVFAAPALAQESAVNSDVISGYGLRNLENAVVIRANPATPSAGDTVHFTAESPIYNIAGDSYTWTIDGKVLAQGTGVSSVDAAVDSKGDALNVLLTVVDPLWGEAESNVTIVPLQLDILYDAPTYVPPFYRGRSLASAGGTMRFQAIARFTQDGTLLPDGKITYTWSRNGSVIGNISGLGKSAVTMTSPALFSADIISVRASAEDDTLTANASVKIPNTEPVPALYEDNPLYGITYHQMLPAQFQAEDQMVVVAVPYFATANNASDPNLQYNWQFDDIALSASSTKINEVTLNAKKQSSKLHLDLTHAINFFLSATADWQVIFGSTNGGTAQQKPGANDAFHNGQQ